MELSAALGAADLAARQTPVGFRPLEADLHRRAAPRRATARRRTRDRGRNPASGRVPVFGDRALIELSVHAHPPLARGRSLADGACRASAHATPLGDNREDTPSRGAST